MPLGKGVRYRYKKGTHIRLAFKNGRVIEAKNTKTGATHTPAEFKHERTRTMNKKTMSKHKTRKPKKVISTRMSGEMTGMPHNMDMMLNLNANQKSKPAKRTKSKTRRPKRRK